MYMPTAYIRGEELDLIPLEKAAFIEGMSRWANDPDVTALMFTGTYPTTEGDLADAYEKQVAAANSVVLGLWSKSDLRLVGHVGLFDIEWIARKAEFRILIGEPDAWGKGHGLTATRAMVDYGFRRLNLNRIWLGVNTENKAALRVYEKTGFAHEGTLRQEVFCRNAYHDVVRMGLLRADHGG